MNINKKRLEHQKNQTLLVGLSIQESAIARQVESAEARATSRCAKYNKNNTYWKRVDELIEKHDELVKSISEKTVALFSNNDDKEDDNEVSEFLNQKSPTKKRKYTQLKNDDDDSIVVFDLEEVAKDDDDEDVIDKLDNSKKLKVAENDEDDVGKMISYEVKEEKVDSAKQQKNVSTRSKRARRKSST